MVIDKPIDVHDYTDASRPELMERVRGIIIRNFEAWQEPKRT